MIKKQPVKIEIETIFIKGQPELGIEKVKFYLVRNWLGYGLIQFKDSNDDRKLDKVFYSLSDIPFSFDNFDPDSGFPGKNVRISAPSSPDWREWLKRFELMLKAHDKKLKELKNQKGKGGFYATFYFFCCPR